MDVALWFAVGCLCYLFIGLSLALALKFFIKFPEPFLAVVFWLPALMVYLCFVVRKGD